MVMTFTRRQTHAAPVDRCVGKQKTQAGTEAQATKKYSSSKGFESTSAYPTGLANATQNEMPLGVDPDPLLEGMSYDLDDKIFFNIYRDMYYHDPVAGCVVDLYSTLPFSEFTLSGAQDKYLEPANEVIERLNFRTIFPQATTDYLVTGSFLSSMLFNRSTRTFEDLMTHRIDNAEVNPLPFVSQDPIIKMTVPEEIRETLKLDSPRITALRNRLGNDFFDQLLGETLELDPLSTIYVPRRSFSFGGGTSMYKRILPLFLIEKNLYRGTIIESGKRQRGIMHLQLGDGDQWEATPEDMDAALELFQNADADPLGAIVATRLGVMVDELRAGGDFWKVTDIWDQTTQFKLRALGMSEAFLSGEANYSTMEGSLTVMLESLRSYRDHMTRCTLYNKVFPLVSMLNGFKKTRAGRIVKSNEDLMAGDIEQRLRVQNDGSRLFIPQVHWNKALKPEGDQAYMDMLTAMRDNGIPVPIRALAAAGGFNLDNLLAQSEEDLAITRRLAVYKKELDKAQGKSADGGDMGSFSSGSAILKGNERKMFNRDFANMEEIVGRTKTGKPKLILNQRNANDRADKAIARAAANLQRSGKNLLVANSSTPFKADRKQR